MAEKASSKKASGSEDPSVSCREMTGLDCDFVAEIDGNVPTASGYYSTQLMSSLSMHMAYKHPGYALSKKMRDVIRERIPF